MSKKCFFYSTLLISEAVSFALFSRCCDHDLHTACNVQNGGRFTETSQCNVGERDEGTHELLRYDSQRAHREPVLSGRGDDGQHPAYGAEDVDEHVL